MSRAPLRSLARAAAASYPHRDRFARHYAYGKLTRDPVFAYLLRERLIPPDARVLDLGCGQGLLAALLHAARTPPASLTGIDLEPRDIERAKAIGIRWGSFLVGDIRRCELPRSDLVMLLDVLHYLDFEAQDAVLGRVAQALSPRGVLLLRVADASGSLRFHCTTWVDRLAVRLRGRPLPRLWCRTLAEWRGGLARRGFRVAAVPMSAGTLFANVLLVASYDEAA